MSEYDQKYIIALKFVNKLLENMGKEEINNLCDFKNIDREDIITDDNKQVAFDMENEMFGPFDKWKCGYYSRNKVKTYVMSVLRGMTQELGLEFQNKAKRVQKDNKCSSHTFYSIGQK